MTHPNPALLIQYVLIYELCGAETEIILFFVCDANCGRCRVVA